MKKSDMPIPDYANYPPTGFPEPEVVVNGRVRINCSSYATARRKCTKCGQTFDHHAIIAYFDGKVVCPPCQKANGLRVSTMPDGYPIEEKHGEGRDYLDFRYKDADLQIEGVERVKKDVFEKGMKEGWEALSCKCQDRTIMVHRLDRKEFPVHRQDLPMCKQGGLCSYDQCPEIAEMKIRRAVQE
jgi:hypothetical protein